MERRLKNIKETLDQTVLQNIKVTEAEKNRIITNLEERKPRNTRPYKYYFSLAAAAVLLVILFVPSFMQNLVPSDRPDSQYAELEEKLSELLGVDVFVPENENYPISLATINFDAKVVDGQPEKGDPIGASVYYVTDLTEKRELSDEERMEWDRMTRRDVIYGDYYDNDGVIHLEILSDGVGTIPNSEMMELEGQRIQYQYVSNPLDDMVVLGFDVNGVGYIVHYFLTDGNAEDDAKQFVQTFLQRFYDQEETEAEVQEALMLLEVEPFVTRYYVSEDGVYVPKRISYRLVFENTSDQYIGKEHSISVNILYDWEMHEKYGLPRNTKTFLLSIAPGEEVEEEIVVDFPLPAGYQQSKPIKELDDPEIVKHLHEEILRGTLEVTKHKLDREILLEVDLANFSPGQ